MVVQIIILWKPLWKNPNLCIIIKLQIWLVSVPPVIQVMNNVSVQDSLSSKFWVGVHQSFVLWDFIVCENDTESNI